MPKARAKTSDGTSAPLVPQAHGGALIPGGTGAGGRPVEHFRRRCREAFEEADGLGFLVRVMKGEETDDVVSVIGRGADAQTVVVPVKPKLRDRLLAAELIVEHGHGKAPQKLEVEDGRAVETGEVVMARILERLPRVIGVLPVDKKALVAWLQRGKAREAVLTTGRVVDKPGGTHGGD